MTKKVKNMKNAVDKAEKYLEKIHSLEEQLRGAVADYRNLESRIQKEADFLNNDRLFRIVDKLLPVLDDLERAQQHLKDNGIKMVIKSFKETLKSEGVEEIEAEKKEFDPETMDCAEIVKGKKNKVVEVLIKGYMLNNKVIRPAKVKVGEGGK